MQATAQSAMQATTQSAMQGTAQSFMRATARSSMQDTARADLGACAGRNGKFSPRHQHGGWRRQQGNCQFGNPGSRPRWPSPPPPEEPKEAAYGERSIGAVVPLGGGPEDVGVRERLFKNMVLKERKDNASIQISGRFKGLLTTEEVLVGFVAVLEKGGVYRSTIQEAERVAPQAFHAARQWINPVTFHDGSYFDMNEFHVFVAYMGHFLGLQEVLRRSHPEMCCPTDGVVQLEGFRKLLRLLAEPAKHGLAGAWGDTDVFRRWEADACPVFSSFNALDGDGVALDDLLGLCVQHAMHSFLAIHDADKGRKKAYDLVQFFSNTPSLPNMVPSYSSTKGDSTTPRELPQPSASSASYGRFAHLERPDEPLYRPAKGSNIRDSLHASGWQVIAQTPRKLGR